MQYVYFFRQVNSPYVKIGKASNDINDRFCAFKTYAPLGAYIVGYIECDNCHFLEKSIHLKYSEKRLKGEFFSLTDDEVYSEINIHNPDFSIMVSYIKQFMLETGITCNQILSLVKSKYENTINQKYKYSDNEKFIELLKSLSGNRLTNYELVELFIENGFEVETISFGKYLKSLGYENKAAKIGGIVKRVYLL